VESSREKLDPESVQGMKYLRQAFRLFDRLASSGCERDRAGNRELFFNQYASLVLLSFFNPTLQSIRGLSAASELKKVQKALGGPRVSVGSLSESVRVFDPELLAKVFEELLESVPKDRQGRSFASIPDELVRKLTAVDGSAFRALPQILTAAGSRGGKWRMHLQFEVWTRLPDTAVITRDEVGGAADERNVLGSHLHSDRVYIMDRGYERYSLFEDIVQAGSDYLSRVQWRPMKSAVAQPISEAAAQAGVVSDELIEPGRSREEVGQITHRVRRLVIEGGVPQAPSPTGNERSEQVVLLTNLINVPAEVLAAMYRLRWQIELFFRFFKHVLGCRDLISNRPEGVAIQIYCALIAALLMSLMLGRDVGRDGFRILCLYFQGWADEDEVLALLAKLKASKKKS
jgi:hypothetical protein